MYELYLTLLGFSIVCNSILLIIFYKRTQKNCTTISLFLLLLSVNIWFIPKFITNFFHVQGVLFESLSRAAALGYVFYPVFLLLFCVCYTLYANLLRRILFWTLTLVPPLIFLFLSWTTNLIGVHSFERAEKFQWGYESPTGEYWLIYIAWYLFITLTSLIFLLRHFRQVSYGARRKQILFFVIAIVLPLIVNIITVGILPIYNIYSFPVGLVLLDIITILGITVIFYNNWFEVTPNLVLSNIKRVILTVDTSGYIIQANSYSTQILKKSLSSIICKPIQDVLFVKHNNDTKTNYCYKLIQTAISKGKTITYNSYTVLMDKSHKLSSSISIAPIYNDSTVIGANVFLRDTKREEIIEKQKNDYFSMLFHELKTPMTSIKAYNQLLTQRLRDSDPDKQALTMKMGTQLDRLARLINDFYELSRTHSGKIALKKEYVKIDNFVKNVVDSIKISNGNRKFIIKGKTNAVLSVDKFKIEQILLNFINNAVKFSPETEPITVHILNEKKRIIIGVQDKGRGIDPKFHKRIFGRFFQVGSMAKEKKGLGIGLFIAQSIVKAHGGKIWLKSRVGEGSTFYFSLPINNVR